MSTAEGEFTHCAGCHREFAPDVPRFEVEFKPIKYPELRYTYPVCWACLSVVLEDDGSAETADIKRSIWSWLLARNPELARTASPS